MPRKPSHLDSLAVAALDLFADGQSDIALRALELIDDAGALSAPLAVLYAVALSQTGDEERAVRTLKNAEAVLDTLPESPHRLALAKLCALGRDWLRDGPLSASRQEALKNAAARWQPKTRAELVAPHERRWKI